MFGSSSSRRATGPAGNIKTGWRGLILAVILVLLVGGLIKTSADLVAARNTLKQQSLNSAVLDFHAFFIQAVLQAEGEIDFETRLKLEGAVRDLNDPEILTAWNTFVKAPNDRDAQIAIKNLLALLVDKVKN